MDTLHRADCLFGPGFWRVAYYSEGQRKLSFYETRVQADAFASLIATGPNVKIQRDACLDAQESDALTPDVVDGGWWLGLPQAEAMDELGITSDADYGRVHRSVSDAVSARDNRQSQGGVRVPVIIRRRKTKELADYFGGGNLSRIKPLKSGA